MNDVAVQDTNTELAKPLFNLGGSQTLTPDDAQESSGVVPMRYFPFLTLFQRTSKGDYKGGSFIFKKSGKDENPIDLGDSFAAIPLSIRGKANYWDAAEQTVEAEYWTATNPAQDKEGNILNQKFFDLRAKARDKSLSEGDKRNPYKAGLDVLLYIPEIKAFATYFANSVSTTAQVEQIIQPFVEYPVRFFSESRSNKQGSWYVPTCEQLPQEAANEFLDSLPSDEQIKDVLELFNNPPKRDSEGDVEGAEVADDSKAKRSR